MVSARETGSSSAAGCHRAGHADGRSHQQPGDTFRTNAMLDNVLVAPDASCDKRAALYANGHDLKDPFLSPIYGDMHGFPPAILTTGRAICC